MKNKVELLQTLKADAEKLNYDDKNLDKVLERAEMLVKKIFGQGTEYVKKIKSISFSPSIVVSGMDRGIFYKRFESGKNELINLINVMLEDLSLGEILENSDSKNKNNKSQEISDKIFIVHGHNEEMKQSSARFLEKIDLKPIILHEQPNKGRTIIEKFSDYSDVSFAIILISADDIAYAKNDKIENANFRARQNVILELGFFLGKIGRENVVVIYEDGEKIEIPSDYQGVLYVPHDKKRKLETCISKRIKSNWL